MIHSHLIFPAELSTPLNACKALSVGWDANARACQSTSEYEGARQGIVDHDILGVSARHYQWGDLPMREHARVCQSMKVHARVCMVHTS